jgi:hypothetical protein
MAPPPCFLKFESGGPEWAGQRVEGTDTMSAAAVAHGALQISVGLLQLAEGRGTRAGVYSCSARVKLSWCSCTRGRIEAAESANSLLTG